MLAHNIISAVRNFLRYPIYSLINVSGLVLGFGCTILIFLWVADELAYDRYHPDNERVFKVMENQFYSDGSVSTDEFVPGFLYEKFKSEYPEVEVTARMEWANDRLFKYGDLATYEFGIYADQTFFSVLNIPIVEGDPSHPFPDKNSIAISKRLAEKFFPHGTAIGNTFRLDNMEDLTVTAVYENRLGANSFDEYEFIMPSEESEWTEGKSSWLTTYVKLKDKNDQVLFDNKIKNLLKEHRKNINSELFIFSIEKWRLYSHFENGKQTGGRITYILSFSAIALFILLIACINFMNLSTARAAVRSKEIGVRKVTGATRGLLVRQFMMESIFLSLAAMVIALLFVHLLLPLFSDFTSKQLNINYADPIIIASLTITVLLTGLIAGAYPAFFLASVRPVSVLKSHVHHVFRGTSLRKILVVFQFSLSMIVITCALVINNQVSFMQNMDVGFDRRNVLIIDVNPQLTKNYQTFRNSLLQEPTVESVSMANSTPMEMDGSLSMEWQGKSLDDDTYFNCATGDHDYISTMGFTLLKGRLFSREVPADTANYVVTEQVEEIIGFKDAIGQHLRWENHEGVIIGVIKNFNNLGIRERLHPTILTLSKNEDELGEGADIFIRYKEGTAKETLERIEKHFKTVSDFPMRHRFLDGQFERMYHAEIMTATLTNWFTALALTISSIGLFGLAMFNTQRRTREISIRKIFGATLGRLVLMLCRDFIRLVMYAILIGLPIAFYLMEDYLTRFPYRTEMSLWMFLIPAVAMLMLAVSVISVQSIKSALTNPIDAMRDE
jgi:putative ABC transport system permease protein